MTKSIETPNTKKMTFVPASPGQDNLVTQFMFLFLFVVLWI